MKTKKQRRHSGYVSPRATISKKNVIRYELFINTFYDDWQNYRDGFRDWFRDFKKIKKVHRGFRSFNEELIKKRIQMNLKQKRLLRRRRIRKNKI
jgi:hypothetical protein